MRSFRHLCQLSGCHAHHGVGNPLVTLDFAEGGCGAPTRAVGWRCYEDRPGKRGWISEDGVTYSGPNAVVVRSAGAPGFRVPDAPAPPLSFDVPLGSTKLTIAYLRSYDARMGVAKIWMDDDDQAAVHLNGTWSSRTSQTDIHSVRIAFLCGESCLRRKRSNLQHSVHVQRVSGRKFKLLLLEVC